MQHKAGGKHALHYTKPVGFGGRCQKISREGSPIPPLQPKKMGSDQTLYLTSLSCCPENEAFALLKRKISPRVRHTSPRTDRKRTYNSCDKHHAYPQIVFPRPGALGLNLRSYLVEPTAGARPGLSPYGCLEVLEAQGVYLQAGDTIEFPPPPPPISFSVRCFGSVQLTLAPPPVY